MKLIVISNPEPLPGEAGIIAALFNRGLEILHLRRPDAGREEMRELVESIPKEFHPRLMLHSHYDLAPKSGLRGIHLRAAEQEGNFDTTEFEAAGLHISASFHRLAQLSVYEKKFDYVLLSPVFDSISKEGYRASFGHMEISGAVRNSRYNVIALGGVNAGNIATVRKMGFAGAALLGALWKSSDPVEEFVKVLESVGREVL